MKAVVMAGGFGTRIQPLTAALPKPMIPVFNKPMMEYIIRSLKNAGITEIIILLYFKPEVIKSYFGDGSSLGVTLHYITPEDDYGTAGAVKKAQHLLDEPFIVVSGDLITDFKLQEVIGYHEAKNSAVTLTLTSVSDPLQFGVVITNKTGKILRFLEKPGWGEVFSDTINTGIYVFQPEILSYIPEGKSFDFSKDLFPVLMSKGITLYGYKAKGYWRDVGNPESYRECMSDITRGAVKLSLPGKRLKKDEAVCYMGENVRIGKNVKLKGLVVLGNDSVVEDNATLENVSVGERCTIGSHARVRGSVLWENVRVGSECSLNNAVLCSNVVFGRNVQSEHGVIIANNTEAGDHVIFDKDVVVWPDKQIEASSIVSSNLIWGDKWKSSIFEGGKVSARTNVELSPEMSAKLGAAFGSKLPRGAKILVSRDYHRASQMLKRAFLGGLLSTGVNAVDLHMECVPINRYKLSSFGEIGGVHFRQNYMDPTQTEILFYDENGNALDAGLEKDIERVFFRDNFRRVSHDEIGGIFDQPLVREFYKEGILRLLDQTVLKAARMKIVVNLLNGATSEVFPDLLNKIGAEAVILNAYADEAKLSRTLSQLDEAERQTAEITKAVGADAGIILYPSGERFVMVDSRGRIIKNEQLLLMTLKLLDGCESQSTRVYLPVYAPTVLDDKLTNLAITRGKYNGIKASFLKDFAFTGTIDNLFAFTSHMAHYDGIYASLKLLEMSVRCDRLLSDEYDEIPDYKYYHSVISCPLDMKGYLMRRMSEEAMDKEASFVDGVKIACAEQTWIHMLPDQYSPNVHLYVEGPTQESAEKLHTAYIHRINGWLNDKENTADSAYEANG